MAVLYVENQGIRFPNSGHFRLVEAYTRISVVVWGGCEWIILHAKLLEEEETKKHTVPKVERNVTLMNILRELLSTAKTVEVEDKHLS